MTERSASGATGRLVLPYGRHWVDEEDIRSVEEVLRSDWLTTGPMVNVFERALADLVGASHAVAVSSGTAALHAAMHAVGVGPGDEVVVPAMTFVATANAVIFQGATPVFADVDPDTLLVDPSSVESLIGPRTKAIVAVDYAGQPCDYDALRGIAERYGLWLIADSCHALGAEDRGRSVGTLADITVFSFHPVKHITTGEGGAVVTDQADLAERVRRFRNHGLNFDHRQRAELGTWYYEMEELGYNYRITDFQCALGLSQLRKLPGWLVRRREIARNYDEAFAMTGVVAPLAVRPDVVHAYHLYVVRLPAAMSARRTKVFSFLRAAGIGVNVHYLPVHLHSFYRRHLSTGPGLCPNAEAAYKTILTLPLHPVMTDQDIELIISSLADAGRCM